MDEQDEDRFGIRFFDLFKGKKEEPGDWGFL